MARIRPPALWIVNNLQKTIDKLQGSFSNAPEQNAAMPGGDARPSRGPDPSATTFHPEEFFMPASRRSAVRIAFALAASTLFAGAAFAQKTQLLVYTALETDQLKAYQEGFNKVHPDIDLKWVRDSTGVITAKLLAEKANPQADVVMGVAASSLALLDRQGMLEPYAPLNLDAIMSQYRDKKKVPAWFGMDVWGATVCFNTVEAQKKGIPKPETWRDLTKPVYKGQVVMPNPASSGTGFFDVTAWLSLWGDDAGKGNGWKYMDALHENIAQYTHSGSKPCNMAAAGEYVVGISFEYRGNTNKAKGAPIDLVFPKEGLGWDLEAFAIMKGTKKLDAAKKLADWASSKDAMLLYGKNFAITAQPGVAAPLANVPRDYEARLVKMDFGWAAENRDRILTEWKKRYDGKTEKR
jgi:iron(III) transport system substrate-binding protein